MTVSVHEILAGATAHAVPLSAECAGYLVLAAADQSALSPRRIVAKDVCLFEDGTVRVAGGTSADDATAERDLRELLGELLYMASSPTSGLLRVQRRAAGKGVTALQRELETALIPVNRAAARRALARLARETERAKAEGRLAPLEPKEPVEQAAPVRAPAPIAAPVPQAAEAQRAEPAPVPEDVAASPRPVEVTIPVVMPPVAPSVSQEHDTRPEPILRRRSSMRPPPLPAVPMLDPVMAPNVSAEARVVTPVLGTRLAPPPLPTLAALAAEAEVEIAVELADDEQTVVPDDVELIVAESEEAPVATEVPAEALATEAPAEPLATEAPAEPLATEAPAEIVAASEPIENPEPTEPCAPLPSESASLPAVSVIPPWVTVVPAKTELVPFRRLPIPLPTSSDVDDLVARLGDAPDPAVSVNDLRAGLKRLAGLEPTPFPPRSVISPK